MVGEQKCDRATAHISTTSSTNLSASLALGDYQ